MKRGGKIRPNRKRKAKLFVRNYHSEGFVDWIHSLACSVSGKEGSDSDPIVAAHTLGKGAGGDWTMVVPMLHSLHDKLHNIGIETFEKRYGVDLELIAAAVHLRWKAFIKEPECNEPTNATGSRGA